MCGTLIKSECACVCPTSEVRGSRSSAKRGTNGKLVQAQDPRLQAHNGCKQAAAAAADGCKQAAAATTAQSAATSPAAAATAAAAAAAAAATAAAAAVGYEGGCARSPSSTASQAPSPWTSRRRRRRRRWRRRREGREWILCPPQARRAVRVVARGQRMGFCPRRLDRCRVLLSLHEYLPAAAA